MNKSNTNYSMLATHVNDLRRMWFLEHEKNTKLRTKMKEFKNLMKTIQAQISFNDSFTDDSFLSGLDRDLSNQSTLEQTVHLQCFQQKLTTVVQKKFIKVVRETFQTVKNHRKEKNQSFWLKSKILLVLLNLFTKKRIIAKAYAFRKFKENIWMRIEKEISFFIMIFKVSFKIKRKAFRKLQVFVENRISIDSINSECILMKRKNGKVNETSPPNFKHYFGPLCSLESDNDESIEEFSSFADSCFGSTEQVRKKLRSGINLEKNIRIIKNQKFFSFLQIIREKIAEKQTFAFQEILNMYENSICFQEGARLVFEVVQNATQRSQKRKLFTQIKRFSLSKKFFHHYLLSLLQNLGKSFKTSIFISTFKSSHSHFTRKPASILPTLQKLSPLLSKTLKSTFTALLHPTSLNRISNFYFTAGIKLYKLTNLLQTQEKNVLISAFLSILRSNSTQYSSPKTLLCKFQASHPLKSVFQTWRTSNPTKPRPQFSRLSLTKLHQLLSEAILLRISFAFRAWQHKIYTIPYSASNKENYYKTFLNFSSIPSKPVKNLPSQPLRPLLRSNFN